MEHTVSKQRFMDSLVNSSIEMASQDDSVLARMLPDV